VMPYHLATPAQKRLYCEGLGLSRNIDYLGKKVKNIAWYNDFSIFKIVTVRS
jgi:hypothetical protein